MAPTPEVLQKRFPKMSARQSTRDIPRVIHAFRGSSKHDRRNFLSTVYPALMSGAMPAEGQERKMQRLVKQSELAPIGGLKHRPSYTRRLSRFAELVDCERKHALKPIPILCRDRRFARPNRMSFAGIPERQESWAIKDARTGQTLRTFFSSARAGEECERLQKELNRPLQVEAVAVDRKDFHGPTIEQLAGDPRLKEWFDLEFGYEGFKGTSCYIWDPELRDPDDESAPLGVIERLVMTAYEHFGLMEEFKDARGRTTKAAGILKIKQPKIAEYLGISTKSVYNANQKWAKLGILRIAHDREEIEGGWNSAPQIVLYLPTRTLTEAEAQIEEVRMRSAVAELVKREAAQKRAQLEKALQVHLELLSAWRGREHCMRAFWKEVGRRLKAAGIDADLITRTIPHYNPSE
jgi:hypothetical protein